MNIKVMRARILEGLKAVQNVVPAKNSLRVLENVLLEAKDKELTLTTTDLDLSICIKVECESADEFSTTLPVKLLFNSISKLPEGVIEITVDDNDVAEIASGKARFTINGISAAEFPKLPLDAEAYAYEVPVATFREMLRKTAYAASQDETRRVLKGVLLKFGGNKIVMVATDGRRLALVENEMEIPSGEQCDIILPAKAVQELSRCSAGEGNIRIKVQGSQVSFQTGTMQIFSKLIDEKYPNYDQVIPQHCQEHVTIDRQLLLDALDRASVMTMSQVHSTKLIFDLNRLVVTAADNQKGSASDEVEINYAGERMEIMFNPNYLMDPLKAIDDDEITIDLNDGHSPVILHCSIPFIYVLMPLRVN